MKLNKVSMPKRCDFERCTNLAQYYLDVGIKGYVFICENCLKELKKVITGELNGKK